MKRKRASADGFLAVDEAGQFVGLSPWILRSWLHKGRLTRYKSSSRTMVSLTELLELTKVGVRPRPLSKDAPLTRMSNFHTEE